MFDPVENKDYVENLEEVETNLDFGLPKKETSLSGFMKETKEEDVKVSDIKKPIEIQEVVLKPKGISIFDIKHEEVQIDEEKEVKPIIKLENENVESSRIDVESNKTKIEDFNTVNTFSLDDNENFNDDTLTKLKTKDIIKESSKTFETAGTLKIDSKEDKVEIPKDTKNFQTAINSIRNCSDSLERFGFSVDVEELDLGNIYQVIFKINK